MPKVTVRGVGIHYEETGSGEPLLLLHGGLGTGARNFRRQAEGLADRYRVILPDMWGYGGSDHRPDFHYNYYYEDAAQMAELLRALGIQRAQVGGFSDGAIVAMCLAMDYPDLVNCLALAAASTYVDADNVRELKKLAPPEAQSPAFQAALARAHGEDYWRDLVNRWVAGQVEVLRDHGGNINRERLPDVRCPVLLLHGADDVVIGSYHSEIIKKALPWAELHVLPGMGHFLLQEAPEETTRLIANFLSRHPLSS